ncbi:uncharacterized protein BP01DRAFT_356755 [Aspergillus saccharolyticus JOP 1030-1]|uniref:Uncharacterized protein n=1 Tax=Aspergillus saccharolyticus JOP 1030-1 TaxID=1450539 RepID=A0A318ZCT0_9EURO|nr:hypothetical protein BP01DRAFT_356755 [Aspergillus saccharolyticus JOP 1030-1]PYH45276.1 hypothetical protein BP01DRAFT_356755 [Aspergillus saccharolyticus JOP 1030-1]
MEEDQTIRISGYSVERSPVLRPTTQDAPRQDPSYGHGDKEGAPYNSRTERQWPRSTRAYWALFYSVPRIDKCTL